MANYDFERVNVLVVEDNAYIRNLIVRALKAFGIGQVKTANHGGEAIDLLRLVASDPMKAGMMSIDIIVSNWQMSPVDGLMLLRWMRRHKESSDRFIPFIMCTGYADLAKIAEARELGVTEVLAKPFSVQTVADRLLRVIERPRQFVHTSSYFGPDRRRQQLPFDGDEQRILTDDHDEVEVLYDG